MRVFSTLWYFLSQGIAYGLVFGAWSTTLMLPVFGTMFGLVWGTGIGAACGILCGLLVSVIQALTFHPEVDLLLYRRRLSLLVGLFVGIVAPILLIASSENILWVDTGYRVDGAFYLNASVIAVIFWGSLSGAYAAHEHPLNEARFMLKQAAEPQSQWGIGLIVRAILGNPVLWIASIVIGIIITPIFFSMHNSFLTIMAGTIMVALLLLLVTFGVAAFMMFLKRLISSEDTMITESHTQRLILTGSAAVFTGVICFWPFTFFMMMTSTTVIVIGLSALGMATAVYQAFPLHGKDKRKAINADLEEKRASS